MTIPARLPIEGCHVVAAKANPDVRGCLYEVFRESWPGLFHAKQWNACVSRKGVVRGVHVHVDYDEFYTILSGRVLCGLHDIRSDSPTSGESVTFEWTADDGHGVLIPRGVAHGFWVSEDAVLAFGLSGYWTAETDVVGCRWDDPALRFAMPSEATLSARDASAGDYATMVADYGRLLEHHRTSQREPALA